MALNLPAPIAAYYAAKNRHDIEGMLAPFAADALVHDEERDYRGHAAIRVWMEETTRKYAVTVEPETLTPEGERIAVRALVSGNFPGSPAHLTYHFTLADGEIAALSIG